MINNAIVHYREDIDLQNLIDFGQREVPTRVVTSACLLISSIHLMLVSVSSVWLLRRRDVHGLVPEHVLQLHAGQPQQRTLLRPLLLLQPVRRQGPATAQVSPDVGFCECFLSVFCLFTPCSVH